MFITLAGSDDGRDLADAGLSFDESPTTPKGARRVIKVSTNQLSSGWDKDTVGLRIDVARNRRIILPWHRLDSVKVEGTR